MAGSQTRLNTSPNVLCSSSPAQRCSLACHPSTRSCASLASSGADVFTPDLPHGFSNYGPAAALPHVAGFPGLGVLRRLRHAPRASADSAPCPTATAARRARGASHVHCDPLDRIGMRLYPCSASGEQSQYLPGHHAQHIGRGAGRPVTRRTRCCQRPTSARFRVASLIKGLRPPLCFRYASRSHSHARGRLAAPPGRTSSGRSAAATRFRAATALSFNEPLHRPAAGIPADTTSSLNTNDHSISHSASWRTSPSR